MKPNDLENSTFICKVIGISEYVDILGVFLQVLSQFGWRGKKKQIRLDYWTLYDVFSFLCYPARFGAYNVFLRLKIPNLHRTRDNINIASETIINNNLLKINDNNIISARGTDTGNWKIH